MWPSIKPKKSLGRDGTAEGAGCPTLAGAAVRSEGRRGEVVKQQPLVQETGAKNRTCRRISEGPTMGWFGSPSVADVWRKGERVSVVRMKEKEEEEEEQAKAKAKAMVKMKVC